MRNDRVFILRESVVKITQMLSGKGIRVTQQGVQAYVKADHRGVPVMVNLPYLPDNATEDLIEAIQGFLDHEVAHILFTEFPLMSKAHAVSANAGFMLNALEDPRIEKEMAKRFAGSAYNLSKTGRFYLDKFVTPRLNEKLKAGDAKGAMQSLMVPMIRALSGQQVFQEFMRDHWATVEPMHARIKDLAPKIEKAKSTQECFDLAIEITKRLTDGKSGEKGEDDSKKGKTGKSGSDKSKGKSKPATGEDSEATDEKSDGEGGAGEGEGKSESKKKTDKEDKGESKSEKDEKDEKDKKDGEDKGEGTDDKDGDDAEGDTKSAKDDDGDDADEEGEDEKDSSDDSDDEEEGDVEESDEEDPEYTGDADGSAGESGGGDDGEMEIKPDAPIWDPLNKDDANDYDEGLSRTISESAVKAASDADYLPYTKDYDVIEKLPVGSGFNPAMSTRLMEAVDHMVAPMQKDLERAVAARSLATRSHGHRSGRLHAANLSRLAFNDDRVFSRKHEAMSKDVAVELVVDASGSMSGSKVHTASQAAYALSSVLDRLKIKNEVICFTTKELPRAAIDELHQQHVKFGIRYSRVEGLYMPVLKGYEERMTPQVRDRFAWLPNTRILRNNVDGECVEVAARRLMAQQTAGKIMIVLSDGYPSAAGMRASLDVHLKSVVEDVTRAGVKVVGIGIESDSVSRFYPKHIILNRVQDLPAAVIKELRHLLMN